MVKHIFAITGGPLTIERVRQNKHRAFVFGDNLKGRGKAGQAVIRGEPNAYGVPTKKAPSMQQGSFFTDAEYEQNVAAIDAAIAKIPEGMMVYVPLRIGLGLSELDRRAPRTYHYLCQKLGLWCD